MYTVAYNEKTERYTIINTITLKAHSEWPMLQIAREVMRDLNRMVA